MKKILSGAENPYRGYEMLTDMHIQKQEGVRKEHFKRYAYQLFFLSNKEWTWRGGVFTRRYDRREIQMLGIFLTDQSEEESRRVDADMEGQLYCVNQKLIPPIRHVHEQDYKDVKTVGNNLRRQE